IGGTWWLRDAAGALVITPGVVLWAIEDFRGFNLDKVLASGATIVAATAVGLIAFSPLIEQSVDRSALGVLAAVPLLWAALRCGGRGAGSAARAHSLVLCGLGHVGSRRAVRGRDP